MEGRWVILFLALLMLFSIPSALHARKLSVSHAIAMDSPKEGAAGTEKIVPVEETSKGLRLSRISQSYLCRACLELSKDAQEILSSPETGHIAIEFFSEHVCHRLSTQTQRRKCEEMVDAYIPLILLRLQDHFAPDKLCTGDQFCGNGSNVSYNHDILSVVLHDASDDFGPKKSKSFLNWEFPGFKQQESKLWGIFFSKFNDVFMKHAMEEVLMNSKIQAKVFGALLQEGKLWGRV